MSPYVVSRSGAVRDARLAQGLRQVDVVERIREQSPRDPRAGSVPTISDAENGKPIRRLSAARIASALGKTLDELFVDAALVEEVAS